MPRNAKNISSYKSTCEEEGRGNHKSIGTWSTKVYDALNSFLQMSSECLAKTLWRNQEHAQKIFSL